MKLSLIATFCAALVLVLPAAAATADLQVTPSPAAVGDTVWVNGCGYSLDVLAPPVTLRIIAPSGAVSEYGVGVWFEGGCMNPIPIVVSESGTWLFEAYQYKGKNRKSAKLILKASTTLMVS